MVSVKCKCYASPFNNIMSYLRGNDFRTAFGKIGGLRASPIMALTATASAETESMISTSLSLTEPVVISQRLNRANIFFSASGIKSLAVSMLLYVCSILSIRTNWFVFTERSCWFDFYFVIN